MMNLRNLNLSLNRQITRTLEMKRSKDSNNVCKVDVAEIVEELQRKGKCRALGRFIPAEQEKWLQSEE